MIIATFGNKYFEVSSKKIYTPNGLSLSEEIEIEETAVSGKKPTVKVKGIKLKTMTFELKLDSRFVDVEKELTDWENILKAKGTRRFNLGNRNLGQYYLSKIEQKEYVLNKNKAFASATISLTFIEDGDSANKSATTSKSTTKKATTVKSSASTASKKIAKGSTIKPKSGVRWYYTAEGALKKTGKSGKAYQKNMKVTYTYSKNGKIVCVNPQGLGWLKVEDVTLVS